jgi:hypothetical protein
MKATRWSVALLCGLALALPLAAQEEPVPAEPPPPPPPAETTPAAVETVETPKSDEPALHRWGGWTLTIAAWEPGLISADEEVAWKVENGTIMPLMAGGSSRIREWGEVTYHLPHDAGMIVGRFDSLYNNDIVQNFTPGQFNFFESRGFPFALGAFDDGLADGVESNITRKTREFRLEFARRVFENKHARGTVKAGYRQLSHDRDVRITYVAIVPNLPPVMPPAVSDDFDPSVLAPTPDFVSQRSSFFGHGIGAAFDVEFPLHPRFAITSGLSIGLIRGASESSYSSQSSYYFLSGAEDVPLTKEELFAILSVGTPPTDQPDDPNRIEDVHQAIVVAAVRQNAIDQIGVTYDLYVGVEGRVWRGLKLFAQLRTVYYANAGEYVVPKLDGSLQRTTLNVGYEGYALGLSWRF